jgi:hypothetical protein
MELCSLLPAVKPDHPCSSLKTRDESYFTMVVIHQNPDDGDVPWKVGFLETPDVAISRR